MSRSSQVIALPKWLIVLRVFQLLLAVIILGISAYGIYWIAFNSWCFALFCSLATLIIGLYAVLTTYVPSCARGYNYWALLALDIFGVIFWLSSMAALAATRAAFVYPTEINGCVNYGYGGVCYKKRELAKRSYVATHGYLNMMSGAAGLSAIEMILFIITLVVFSIHLRRTRASGNFSSPTNDKLEAHPMNPVAYEQTQQAQYTVPPQPYTPQQQYDPPPQNYVQQSAPEPYQGIEVQQNQTYTQVPGQHYG